MKHIKKLAERQNNRSISVERIVPKMPTKTVVAKRTVVIQNQTNLVQSPILITEKEPLINIITRTSGRPNSFKRCRDSIKGQTYQNIRHIVSIDSLADKSYVEISGAEFFFIDKEKTEKIADIPNPNTGKRFIYNLYFNTLIEKINEGWILILDDDDYLIDNNSIQSMVNEIKSNTDLLIFQMKYPTGNLLPPLTEMNAKPRLGRIGSPCILVHSGIAKTIKWDGWKCGDYRFISKVWDKTKDKRYIKRPLIMLGGAGLGLRNDVNINNTVKIQPTVTSNTNENQKIVAAFQKKFVPVKVEHKITPITGGISILITAYKTSKYIKECLDSIESQSFFSNNNEFEVIIGVDACMETYNKLLSIKDNYRNLSIYLMESNVGTYVTMNTIAPYSKYSNLIRFDSDDVMKPNMISDIMKIDNKYDIIRFKFTAFSDNIKNVVTGKSFHAVGAIFMKRSTFDMAGGYVNSKFSSDSELVVRLSKFTKTHYIDNQLFFYRKHPQSLSFTVPSAERLKFDAKTNANKYTLDNLKIKSVLGKIKTMNRSHKFNQEIHFFLDKIKNKNPFSIVRYGDGEMMILENKPIDLSQKFNGEHKFVPENAEYQKLKTEMLESIQYKSSNYYVGLPCPCCVKKENVTSLIKTSGQNDSNLTWANIFVNSNYNIFKTEFLKTIENQDVVVICNQKSNTETLSKKCKILKEFRIGANAWLNNYSMIDEIIEYSKIVSPNTIFLFMAGTFTKLTIYKIHKTRQDLFLLDLGSSLDLVLSLGETRNYLKPNSTNINKVCTWLTA